MARELWHDPNNPANFVLRDSRNGPPPPAGYVLQETADGTLGGGPETPGSSVFGRLQQTYIGGQSSGGWPPYGPDKGKNMNGILGT
jgi:hypothetical protein